MTKLGLLCGGALCVLGVFASCSGDEPAKKARDTDAGAAGAEQGGGPAIDAGGSSMLPSSAGQGGAPVGTEGGAGGEPAVVPAAGMGGAPLVAEGGAGGVAETAGAPGSGGSSEVATFEYSCGVVRDTWSPSYDSELTTYHLDVSTLQVTIVSGTVHYFVYNAQDDQFCGSAPVEVNGNDVSAFIDTQVSIERAQISFFSLTDSQGNQHNFDPIGASCFRLEATSNQERDWPMICAGAAEPCPEACN